MTTGGGPYPALVQCPDDRPHERHDWTPPGWEWRLAACHGESPASWLSPTGVLTWLAKQDDRTAFSLIFIAQKVAPVGADVCMEATDNALRILFDAGHISGERFDGADLFKATPAGRDADANGGDAS